MVLRNSIIYFFVRIAQSSIVFMTVILYTRLLTPAEYGIYTLVVSAVALVNGLVGQWLYSTTLRLTATAKDVSAFVSTVVIIYGCILAFVSVACTIVFFVLDAPIYRHALLFGLALLCINGVFDLNLNLLVASLHSARFALLSIARTICSALLGAALAYFGWGYSGVLSGAIIGGAIPGVSLLHRELRDVSLRRFDREAFQKILGYGLPLSIGFAFSSVSANCDRLLLAVLADARAVGLYMAALDIANRIVVTLMASIGNATFSQATYELERKGPDAAQRQLRENFILLFAIGCPAAIGLTIIASQLSMLAVGAEFRDAATVIIPFAAVTSFLNNLRSHYFDHAFQLGRQTGRLVIVMAVTAVAAIALNVLWIPSYGALGAAYAMLTAYALSLPLCILMSRWAFPLPLPLHDAGKILIATAVMGAVVYALPDEGSFGALCVRIGAGAFVYFAQVILMLPTLRRNLLGYFRRRLARRL